MPESAVLQQTRLAASSRRYKSLLSPACQTALVEAVAAAAPHAHHFVFRRPRLQTTTWVDPLEKAEARAAAAAAASARRRPRAGRRTWQYEMRTRRDDKDEWIPARRPVQKGGRTRRTLAVDFHLLAPSLDQSTSRRKGGSLKRVEEIFLHSMFGPESTRNFRRSSLSTSTAPSVKFSTVQGLTLRLLVRSRSTSSIASTVPSSPYAQPLD